MKYTEKLLWILDKDTEEYGYDEEKFRINIDFVHSLGLKCDCVGWCSIDLGDPKTEFYLEKITAFCKENGFRARGWYTRTCVDTGGDWYRLGTGKIPDGAICEHTEVYAPVVSDRPCTAVKGYFLDPPMVRSDGWRDTLVPARVKRGLEELGEEGLTFCWIRDVGRYEAESYFQLYTHAHVARYWSGEGADRYAVRSQKDADPALTARVCALGGMLPRLTEIFSDLTIAVPDCYPASELPREGLVEAFAPRWHDLLIHRTTARKLLDAKVISPRDLAPVFVAEECPAGYAEEKGYKRPAPSAEYIASMEAARIQLAEKPRPRRAITEKQAVSTLRKAKRERKEDFQKALPKAVAESLADTPYAPLAPYYAVAAGGELSDEYELLAHARALEETAEFMADMQAEELLEDPPRGVVIARCPDGDRVLLTPDGKVIRYSHEDPTLTVEWPTLAQFFYDSILIPED